MPLAGPDLFRAQPFDEDAVRLVAFIGTANVPELLLGVCEDNTLTALVELQIEADLAGAPDASCASVLRSTSVTRFPSLAR